jgi:hypothetical protein
MVGASRNRGICVENRSGERRENSDGTEPAMGFGAVFLDRSLPVAYRFERCLIRAVSS